MRGGEAPARLHEDLDHFLPRRLGTEPSGQALAADELHGHKDLAVRLADLVHGHHVGMREPSHRLCFPLEATLRGIAIASVGSDDLDGDLAVQLLVVGGIYRAHATSPDLLEHGEATDQRWRGLVMLEPAIGKLGGRLPIRVFEERVRVLARHRVVADEARLAILHGDVAGGRVVAERVVVGGHARSGDGIRRLTRSRKWRMWAIARALVDE